MKILYFYQYFGTPKGSWSTRVYEFTRRWVKEGHEVTVVTSPYDKSDISGKGLVYERNIEGVRVIVINIMQSNKHSFLRRIATFLMFSLFSIYYTLTLSCQIVICSSGPITIGLPGLIAKWLRQKKLVFEVRDLWPEGAIGLGILKNSLLQKISYLFEKVIYRNSDLIVACSNGMQQSILDRYPQVKTTVVTNASDTELFQDHNIINGFRLPAWAEDIPYYLYAGSLGAMDDVKVILDAAKLIITSHSEIRFVIIGDGMDKSDLMKYKEEHSIENVIFLDLLPKNEIVGWMKYSKAIFVLFKNIPVIGTSSPNKLFDAFAAGKAVIQNTSGWMKELVNEHKCGINVEANNPIDLVSAIEITLHEPKILKQMESNSLDLGRKCFDRNVLSKKYLNAIISI